MYDTETDTAGDTADQRPPVDPDNVSDPSLDDPTDDDPQPDEDVQSDWTSEGGAMQEGPATDPTSSHRSSRD